MQDFDVICNVNISVFLQKSDLKFMSIYRLFRNSAPRMLSSIWISFNSHFIWTLVYQNMLILALTLDPFAGYLFSKYSSPYSLHFHDLPYKHSDT